MIDLDKKQHRCCFTGHRPEKLTKPENKIIKELEAAVQQAVQDGYRTFITGMARGVDIWAAEIVLKLQAAGQPLKLVCAPPYSGFEQVWDQAWQRRYHAVLKQADWVQFVCAGYSKSCFQIRNQWMVDHSARVIAVWNGEKSGTQNTLHYARRRDVPVVLIKA